VVVPAARPGRHLHSLPGVTPGRPPAMPILEQHEVAAYLFARGLVGRRSVVAGTLRITDATSRNRNFRVSGTGGDSYLLKQGIAADSAESLANEAALYRRLTAAGGRLAAAVPHLHRFDAARSLLIVEWIAGGEDLYRHHAGRRRCSVALARALSRVLAALHAIAPDDEPLRRDAPWVLSLHRPRLDALRYLTAPSVELIAAIQRDAPFVRALDALREDWRVEALVHRDVKWANCIVLRPAAIKLVDWEMAGWGDPALDVGSALGELLGWRLRSGAKAAGGEQPAMAAFWRAYAVARALDAQPADELLVRALRYAGARLVQSAYEKTQETALAGERVARGLELGRELLLAPRAAAGELRGGAT
jgi:aminoglycoside phosphotransferase (APT) family kinase protein